MGVRVLRFDGAFAPRVLKFDTACGHEGCGGRLRRQYYKTFTTGLRPRENMQIALRAKEKRSPFGGWRHHLSPASGGTTTRDLLCATYEIIASRSFIVPPHSGGKVVP